MTKQKALHRDDKYSDKYFKVKAEISAIIILYLEIRPLCLDRVISHQQFRVSIVTTNQQTHGMVLFLLMFVPQLFCPHCAGHHVTISYDVIGHYTILNTPQSLPQQ